jgi:hypothetical protein
MRTRSMLLLGTFAATACLLLTVAGASARRLEVSATSFLMYWASSSPLVFTEAGGTSVSCPLSLEGSFHSRAISKTSGALVGYINEAILATCSGGSGTVLTETLPWHVQYNSFSGTLPNITAVTFLVLRASFRIRTLIACLAATSAREPWFLSASLSSGRTERLEPLREHTIALTGEGLCSFGSPARLSGAGRFGRDPGAEALTIRLIA